MTIGLIELFKSKKGTLSILVLAVTGLLAMTGHMDPAVAACLAVVQGIYCWTDHKVAIANAGLPDRGQL